MIYRTLGRTGINVSLAGVGGSSLPKDSEEAYNLLKRSFELGVNYVDISKYYINSNAEEVLKEALKTTSNKIYVGYKLPHWEYEGNGWLQKEIERAAKSIDINCIDFLMFWDLKWSQFKQYKKDMIIKEAQDTRNKGIVKYLGLTTSDEPQNVTNILKTEIFDCITLEYNLLNRSNEDVIKLARNKNIGVSILGSLAGGFLADKNILKSSNSNELCKISSLAYKFSLLNDDISMILTGQSSIEHLEMNIHSICFDSSADKNEKIIIKKWLNELRIDESVYCNRCKSCAICDCNVNIDKILTLYKYCDLFGVTDYVVNQYSLLKNKKMDIQYCIKCKRCMDVCDKNIDILYQFSEMKRFLNLV